MTRGLPILFALLAGCGTRDVVVTIDTPAMCCDSPGCEPECPLAGASFIHTVLERVDGTIADEDCIAAPEGICRYEDLESFVFLERVTQPSEAVEVRVEGRTSESCHDDQLVFNCDSFGEHVVDLTRDDHIALFCDCPFTVGP